MLMIKETAPPKGEIYFIQCGPLIKIGWTQWGSMKRLRQLQCGNPEPLKLIGVIEGQTQSTERLIHYQLKDYHYRGEWFNDCPKLRRIMTNSN